MDRPLETLVDGVGLVSVSGHRVRIDGEAGGYLVVKDAGGRVPLPPPGWMAIGPFSLASQIDAGNWKIVDEVADV